MTCLLVICEGDCATASMRAKFPVRPSQDLTALYVAIASRPPGSDLMR